MSEKDFYSIDWRRGNKVRLTNGKEYLVKGMTRNKKYLVLYSEEYEKDFIANYAIVDSRTSDYVEPEEVYLQHKAEKRAAAEARREAEQKAAAEARREAKKQKSVASKAAEPVAEAPKTVAAKAAKPVAEAPKAVAPKAAEPVAEAPKTVAPKAAEPVAEAPQKRVRKRFKVVKPY